MDCPYCFVRDPEQDVVFRDDLVWFLQDRRYQGALKHSGVIIPVAHRETVFDLTEAELATFKKKLQPNATWHLNGDGRRAVCHHRGGVRMDLGLTKRLLPGAAN